ncbi:unnamed protein product [Protopolystoma xenopodis]|uniref:Uncharacterized protein n=1 Tax=Protopolystoma xenopodis TaxID=117903 RepID=A0A3S5FD83_9PLAT|nr:unnamed protein product [Protopolystoma xenopodis]
MFGVCLPCLPASSLHPLLLTRPSCLTTTTSSVYSPEGTASNRVLFCQSRQSPYIQSLSAPADICPLRPVTWSECTATEGPSLFGQFGNPEAETTFCLRRNSLGRSATFRGDAVDTEMGSDRKEGPKRTTVEIEAEKDYVNSDGEGCFVGSTPFWTKGLISEALLHFSHLWHSLMPTLAGLCIRFNIVLVISNLSWFGLGESIQPHRPCCQICTVNCTASKEKVIFIEFLLLDVGNKAKCSAADSEKKLALIVLTNWAQLLSQS